MITNDNTCNKIGDTLIWQSVIMEGITTITSFSESTSAQNANKFFVKTFQFSLDGGVRFSDWFDLTTQNITGKVNEFLGSNYQQLVFRFKYVRAGTDNTGVLSLFSLFVNGVFVPRQSVFLVTSKTQFKDLAEKNIDVLNLMVNLAQKMYAEGIVPAFFERGEDDTNMLSDEDYIDFWEIVARYYSMFIIDSLKFENIYWKRPLLCEYLRQKNIFFCNCNNVIELQLIAQNYYVEMQCRGTEEVFKPKGYQYKIGHRTGYKFPTGYSLMPSERLTIDGVVFTEVKNLPHGWVIDGQYLVAPDRNYHKVEFFDYATQAYVAPLLKSLFFPTSESKIFKKYNGEYLRLICFNEQCDEFIYNNVAKQYVGWCLGNSSPLYMGLRPQRNASLLKAYEKQANVQDLAKYPLRNGNQMFVGITENPYGETDTVMYISSNGQPCYDNVIPHLLNISKHLNIKIYFDATSALMGSIKFVNLLTLDEFVVPVEVTGDGVIEVDTDLVPARYSVEFMLTWNHNVGYKLSGFVGDGDAVQNDILELTTASYLNLFNMSNVGTDQLLVQLNIFM